MHRSINASLHHLCAVNTVNTVSFLSEEETNKKRECKHFCIETKQYGKEK